MPFTPGIFNRMGVTVSKLLAYPRRHLLSSIGYLAYILALVLVFLYLTFPYPKLEARLIAQLEENLSSRIRVNESKWIFPVGLRWQGIHVRPQAGFKEDLVLDKATVKIYLLPLLRQRISADFVLEAGGGKVRGNFASERRDGKIHYYLQKSTQDLPLELAVLDHPLQIKGRLKTDLEASWTDQAWTLGRSSGTVELSGIQTEPLSLNGLEIPGLVFSRVAAKVGMDQGLLKIEQLSAQGPQVEATGQGSIMVRNRWEQALLNLTVRTHFKEEIRRQVPVLSMLGGGNEPVDFVLKGTPRCPILSINGTPFNYCG